MKPNKKNHSPIKSIIMRTVEFDRVVRSMRTLKDMKHRKIWCLYLKIIYPNFLNPLIVFFLSLCTPFRETQIVDIFKLGQRFKTHLDLNQGKWIDKNYPLKRKRELAGTF